MSKVIEFEVKILPTWETSDPDGFTMEYCQTLKEEKIPVLYTLFQKIKKEKRKFPNKFHNASIILTLKLDEDITGKKLRTNIPHV